MKKMRNPSFVILIASLIDILYALAFRPADWIVYTIAIVGIPFFVLSIGLLNMSKPKKDEEDERTKAPFIGY